MSYTIANGKFPKKPDYGNVLEACRKDFKNFKNDNGNRVIEQVNSQIKRLAHSGGLNNILIEQKENLEKTRSLIREGKEDVAFSVFFRTFPSCLPHRTRMR
jgi:hypothetical protein